MRRFFTVLFVVSLLATGAAVYWQTYLPELRAPAPADRQFSTREAGRDHGAPSAREFAKKPSDRQNLAVTISILSSIISAVAAVAQTWLTARAFRR